MVDDSDTPQSAVAVATVVVTVLDANDNPPTFHISHYSATIPESTEIGDIVVGTVSAFDEDEVHTEYN